MGREYRLMEWTEEYVRRFWEYEAQFPENSFSWEVGGTVVKCLAQYLPPGIRVLDYGCGPGYLIPHLLARRVHVTGAESSDELVNEVNKKFAKSEYFSGAVRIDELRTRKACYDVIVLLEILEHLDDRHLQTTIDAVRNLLVVGGYAIITVPNEEDLSKRMVYCPEADVLFNRWQHLRSWSGRSLSDCLASNGFVMRRIWVTDFGRERTRLRWAKERVKKALRVTMRCVGLRNDREPKAPHLVAVVQRPS